MRTICETAESDMAEYHNKLDQQAAAIASGVTVTPYIVGACNPHWDAAATASISGITLSTNRTSIYRGILEAIAGEFAVNLGILEKLCGSIGSVRISGRGSRSNLGLTLRRNLSGVEITTSNTAQCSCLGAAMLAGLGCGVFEDINASTDAMVDVKNKIE